jgi:hypothetical protein
MATDSERLAALEARVVALEVWIDTVTPTLRNLARRTSEAPVRDATGAPRSIAHPLPDGCEPPDVLAAVPTRAGR